MEEFPNVSWNRPGRRGLVAAGVMRPSFTLHPIRRHRLVQPFLYFSKSSTKRCNITGRNYHCTCKACRFQPNPQELQTTLPFSKMVLLHLSTHQIKQGRQSYQRKRPLDGMHERGEQAFAEPELNLNADCTKFNIIAPNQAPVV